MSAIRVDEEECPVTLTYGCIVELPKGFQGIGDHSLKLNVADMIGKIAFLHGFLSQYLHLGIASDGHVPEITIPDYVGQHPERLVEGFTESRKPKGCEWMESSSIVNMVNYKGSVLVQLEPAEIGIRM